LLLRIAKIPSASIFIIFQRARVGRFNQLLTVKDSKLLFNFSTGWSLGKAQHSFCADEPFWRAGHRKAPIDALKSMIDASAGCGTLGMGADFWRQGMKQLQRDFADGFPELNGCHRSV
jgi:hypothetical protein